MPSAKRDTDAMLVVHVLALAVAGHSVLLVSPASSALPVVSLPIFALLAAPFTCAGIHYIAAPLLPCLPWHLSALVSALCALFAYRGRT